MKKLRIFLQNILYRSLNNNAHSRAFYTLIGVTIKEFRCVFKQFYTIKYPFRSLLNVISIIFSTISRIFFGRSLKYSFAFTGEDRIIEGILKPLISESGVYIDIGCNHPKLFSNTYGLYRKGWKGVCVDANPRLIRKYQLYRPKDIAICQVVSNSVEEVDFYQIENDVLSTIDKKNLEDAVKLGLSYKTEKRKTSTLTSILKKYNIQRDFDILSIDAEEHDLEVLRSLDFSFYQPKLIIVEDETFVFKTFETNEFVKFLGDKGYEMAGHVLKNSYFLKIGHNYN